MTKQNELGGSFTLPNTSMSLKRIGAMTVLVGLAAMDW